MPLHLFSTVIRRYTKMSLFIGALLFSASMLDAQDAVYFKCRWTGDYIYCVAKTPSQNPTSNAFVNLSVAKTLWFIERVDDTWVRLRTKDSLYLNVEKGKLDAGKVPAAFLSSHWKLPATDGHNLIINRWTGVYINFEHHDLEASAAQPGMFSAQWSMEDKDGTPLVAKDFSLNAYTSFLPDQQKYYRLQDLKYDLNPIYMDINRARSSELATLADYGGDNSGKAWKFTQVSDGWYKISNLKLGGQKVLAIAKNTDGSYYFVLTDFANYPNQLWRMIQYKDQTLLNYATEKKLHPENFTGLYYTLVSKQHGLEAIKSQKDVEHNQRFLQYSFDLGVYTWSPFDIFWKVKPVDDIAAIKNIPLSAMELNDLIKATTDKALKAGEEAILKATPIATSPFKPPVGHIIGEPYQISSSGLGILTAAQHEYTMEEWASLSNMAGKIPMVIYNNTNLLISIVIKYTDESGQFISTRYVPITNGKHINFYLDPMCTYISFTGISINSADRTEMEVYHSTRFYRSKGVKIYLDGNENAVKESIWNW